jgi:hypothetical protein
VAEQEGAVANVDVGVGQVLRLERNPAAELGDASGGLGGDLHQAPGTRARSLVAEPRLLVDDRGDQRRVEVLLLRLLADDVVVAQWQRHLADRLADVDPADREGDQPPEAERQEEGPGKPAPHSPSPLPSFAITSATDLESCSLVPSLASTCVARAAFSSWGS